MTKQSRAGSIDGSKNRINARIQSPLRFLKSELFDCHVFIGCVEMHAAIGIFLRNRKGITLIPSKKRTSVWSYWPPEDCNSNCREPDTHAETFSGLWQECPGKFARSLILSARQACPDQQLSCGNLQTGVCKSRTLGCNPPQAGRLIVLSRYVVGCKE